MSEIENALAWADHKKAAIVPAHTLAAEVRRLRAKLAALAKSCAEMLGTVSALADNSYCQSLEQYKMDACLGKEAKIATGKFTKDNLDAHRRAAESMGRHRAYAEVRRMFAALTPIPAEVKEK